MMSLPRRVPLRLPISTEHMKIFATLQEVNEKERLGAVLRVAGGWVRDTLLGVHSNDIDIAIETTENSPVPVSGQLFAEAVSRYQAALAGTRVRTVSTIRVNPALSKHIETATVCVHDIPVEFCALRTDDYCDDSRIPQVRAATPQEDAERRDFTVNALFYNLNTGFVEDYTSGLQDLEARVLRCPIAPRETFRDDPLRLLRGVRFVGQLGELNFHLCDSIPAAVDGELLDMLLRKVSRERIGKEFTKMLMAARPEKCIDILMSMNVLQRVLLVEVRMKTLPGKKKQSAEIDSITALCDGDPKGAMERVRQINAAVFPLFTGAAICDAPELFQFSPHDKMVAVLFMLLIPFFPRQTTQSDVETRLYHVIINSLKMPANVHGAVFRLVDSYHTLAELKFTIEDIEGKDPLAPESIMKVFKALTYLKDKNLCQDAFRLPLLAYLLLECRSDILQSGSPSQVGEFFWPIWGRLKAQRNLLDAFEFEPLISGSDLRNYKGIQPKQIGEILTDVRMEMVFNPDVTREQLFNMIVTKYVSL